MKREQTHDFMKKDVELAKTMEGSWQIRMSMAMNSVIIDHYLTEKLTKQTASKLIHKGVSYRRIKKNFNIDHYELQNILA